MRFNVQMAFLGRRKPRGGIRLSAGTVEVPASGVPWEGTPDPGTSSDSYASAGGCALTGVPVRAAVVTRRRERP